METLNCIKITKALADSSRLMILNSLMDMPQYVEELSERLNLVASTISFHLKKLENAGLVYKKKEQYYVVYHINDEMFNLTLRELTCFENLEKYVQGERIQKYRKKVIDAFFKNAKLIKVPAQHKKKLIILEEFAKQFKRNILYDESEVNEIISEMYEDYHTIREMLINENIMERDDQKYRLIITKYESESKEQQKNKEDIFFF